MYVGRSDIQQQSVWCWKSQMGQSHLSFVWNRRLDLTNKHTLTVVKSVNKFPPTELWLRRLVTNPSHWSRFDAGSAHVRLLENKVVHEQVCLSNSVPPVSIIPPLLHSSTTNGE
jgi:hypothetical protein